MQRTIPSIVIACAAPALLLVSTSSLGCASSSASRAQRDNARTISLSEYRQAARQLAVDIVSSPKFKRFREAEVERNAEVVVMLDEYRNETTDPTFDTTLRQLFTALEEELLENDMTFQQALDEGLPNYSAAGGRMDSQDSDDRFDQSTGDVSTGSAKKAVLSLQLEVQRSRVSEPSGGSSFEYVLIARLANARKVSMLSKSYPITKPNR